MANKIFTLLLIFSATSAYAEDPFVDFEDYLRYLSKRDKVLSENIANADTPRYAPAELERRATKTPYVDVRKTNSSHMDLGEVQEGFSKVDGEVLEEKRNGNKVTLEHELFKKSENAQKMQEVLNVYNKSRAMYKTAIIGTGR